MQLLDFDAKRIYLFEELRHATEHWLSATSENMTLSVDMTSKKVAPFAPNVRRRAGEYEGRPRRPAAAGDRRAQRQNAGKRLTPLPFGPYECHVWGENQPNMAEAKKLPPPSDLPAPAPAAGSISARALGARQAPYLADLNPEQRQAVETLDGPVLVLAGAGTGKTRVLTTRIAHILNLGRARPGDILAVTFTNKAAREMKTRVGAMVGRVVEGMPWLGTFHSIGVKILRRHAELVGLKSDFTILDVDDQVRLMKQLIAAENIDEKRWPGRVLAMLIDGWKNRGLTPDLVPAGEAAAFANGKGKKLYLAYQERLKTLNAADFGDLLLENIRLFRENPDVLRQYQGRFRFILVDEYQDTNVAQYLWLRLLSQTQAAPQARFPSPLEGEGGEPERSEGEPGRAVRPRGYVRRADGDRDPSAALARLRLRSGTLSLKGRGEREFVAPPRSTSSPQKHLLRRR